ncbi:MAG: hypothetical protein ACLTSZ_14240 [Lachnospiraceae bacterium]
MKKIKRARCIAYILLILISIAMLFPFFWMVRSAFMTNREIADYANSMVAKPL